MPVILQRSAVLPGLLRPGWLVIVIGAANGAQAAAPQT